MGIAYDWQEVDILAGNTRTPEFLAMNVNGKIPLLALPDGRHLPESNAILFYLADGSEFFAGDTLARAEILQWMFFEQYSHEPFIATARFIIKYLGNASSGILPLTFIARNSGLRVSPSRISTSCQSYSMPISAHNN